MGFLSRHVKSEQCQGSLELLTESKEKAVRDHSRQKFIVELRSGSKDVVRDVVSSAREHMLITQVDERKRIRELRAASGADTSTRKKYRLEQKHAAEYAASGDWGEKVRQARMVGEATLIADEEERGLAIDLAVKYGTFPEWCGQAQTPRTG